MELLPPDRDCVLGGEIKNSVIFGYSNKAHDGYLGDSIIGEWCNLGAGTTNSNMKNSGGPVRYLESVKKSFCGCGTEIRTPDGRLFQVGYSNHLSIPEPLSASPVMYLEMGPYRLIFLLSAGDIRWSLMLLTKPCSI